MKSILFIILLALAACSSGEPLPPITGIWFALNPDHWTPTAPEQDQIKALPER